MGKSEQKVYRYSLYYSCNSSINVKLYIYIFFSFNKFIYLFISCVGSPLLCAGFLQLQRAGATLHCGARASHCGGLSLLWTTGSRCAGFSSCGTQAQQLWLTGSRAQAQQLWRMGLVAPRHVGYSGPGLEPCIVRQILNHCTTRGVQNYILK